MIKTLRKNDVSDARYLLDALFEYTDDPQANWYFCQLLEFINRTESELFPDQYHKKMNRLRNRMNRIRNHIEEYSATSEEEC